MVKDTYTVRELIDILETVEDKELPVFVYIVDLGQMDEGNPTPITLVDLSISDRVDFNV